MYWLTTVLFALALNIDSLSTGIAYGIRRIRLPFLAIGVISVISAGAITISMYLGNLIGIQVDAELAHRIGGILLILLGIWLLYQGVKVTSSSPPASPQPLEEQENANLILRILRQPQDADFDFSGDISLQEAAFLGLALAMDAFSAGFAVSLLGFSIWFTALAVGIGHILLIYIGLCLGRLLGLTWQSRLSLTYFPGGLIMAMGIYKLVVP
ncbi:MAG: sporulation membrane protein YtaF [Syntrophomonadaceae bacterium]|nr:sporulation membrane protein YtaF [Syntrophomonadaceae bacterium]